ncbi:MAG: hypothetical protein M3457_13250 [Chloroflexota bacterium]|nr:hypothetical protein [Chloroflexota bacterium]
MNYPSRPSRNSMSRDFLTFGNDGIALNRTFERRLAEQARDHMAASLGAPGALLFVRRWLGNVLIATGAAIAGAVSSSDPEVAGHGPA